MHVRTSTHAFLAQVARLCKNARLTVHLLLIYCLKRMVVHVFYGHPCKLAGLKILLFFFFFPFLFKATNLGLPPKKHLFKVPSLTVASN